MVSLPAKVRGDGRPYIADLISTPNMIKVTVLTETALIIFFLNFTLRFAWVYSNIDYNI